MDEYGTESTEEMHFFYDAQNKPAFVEYEGTMYRYVHNLQGDIVAIVDAAGNLVVEYRYDAWGKLLSATGMLADTLGKWNPFRYRGYVYDDEVDVYYLRRRYYSPDMSRFVNEDSNVGQRGALLAHNLFCYCANLPIIGVDYSGSETLWMAKLGMEPELNEAVNNLPFATKLKHWPINWRLGTILARIESNLSAIEYASQKTKTPQAMIQAVLFRKILCYGLEDKLLDWRNSASKGIAQIKIATARKAETYFDPTIERTDDEYEALLNDDASCVYYCALVLSYEAARKGYSVDSLSRAQVQEVFSAYNGASAYGEATIQYYDAFLRHIE